MLAQRAREKIIKILTTVRQDEWEVPWWRIGKEVNIHILSNIW